MAVATAFGQHVKPLRPATVAFALALVSSTGPRALSVLLAMVKRRSEGKDSVATKSVRANSFPVFCAVLIGGSTVLEEPVRVVLEAAFSLSKSKGKVEERKLRVLSRSLATLMSAGYSFHLFNKSDLRDSQESFRHEQDSKKISTTTPRLRTRTLTNHHHPLIPPSIPKLPPGIETPVPTTEPRAGKTIDLTLFMLIRAIDAFVTLAPPPKSPRLRHVYDCASPWVAPVLFSASCAAIMHAFFYTPLRLPGTYVRWIGRISGADPRLVHALRQVRYGSWVYGKQGTGMEKLLRGACEDLGLPVEYADPAVTVPVPCEIVHGNLGGGNCEEHALKRFARSWVVAAGVYAPLAALLLVRRFPRRRSRAQQRAVLAQTAASVARSATFLAAFVSSFYYGICLARRRLGPRLFPWVTAQRWDAGLCIDAGCALCGWSILAETPRRQAELMLFVLPRALTAAMVGRQYPRDRLWLEHVVFTCSAACVLTVAREKQGGVRGVLGKVLGLVYGK